MKPYVVIGIMLVFILVAFGFVIVTVTHAQTCMNFGGGLYSCTDGTQGMTLPGGIGQYQNPRTGTMGSTFDLGGGLSTFSDNHGRSGTQFQQGSIGLWQDNEGRLGNWMDLNPTMRNYTPSTPYMPRSQRDEPIE